MSKYVLGHQFERIEDGMTNSVRVTFNGFGVGSFAYSEFGGPDGAMAAAKLFVHDRQNPVDPYAALRDAMQDLLTAPKGEIPASCEDFYDAELGRFSTAKVNQYLDEYLE